MNGNDDVNDKSLRNGCCASRSLSLSWSPPPVYGTIFVTNKELALIVVCKSNRGLRKEKETPLARPPSALIVITSNNAILILLLIKMC